MLGSGLGFELRFKLGLGSGLSDGSGNSDREPLANGNSDQKPRNCQHCYYQHLWLLIPKVGNSANNNW